MKTTTNKKPAGKRAKGKKVWLAVLIVLALIAGGAGYLYWTQQTATAAQAEDEGFQTTKVRQGSITLSTTGSGSLTAGKESALSFSTTGVVAEVNVEVGDQVTEGQKLAVLDDLESLQSKVNTAQQDLNTAQRELQTLKDASGVNLANAQLSLAEAQKALTDAKSAVVQEGWARCDQETIDTYYYRYTHAKEELESLGDGGGITTESGQAYYLNILVPAKNKVAQASAAYVYCAGYTDYEIDSSQASLTLAEAELKTAEETLDDLNASSGVDPLDLAVAENKVATAQLALAEAEETLAGATITAPFAGTILSVAGEAGDSAGSSTFIEIADLAHPRIEFSVDETDLSMVAVGEQATITFDAVPDRTFSGKVIRINPELSTGSGYSVLSGLIEMDLGDDETTTLPKGLNASVELLQASAENVLLVPLQAVRDLGDGTYAVFVVDESGEPKMRVVEVGLMDAASAEIKSGLSMGDTVTTGITETR